MHKIKEKNEEIKFKSILGKRRKTIGVLVYYVIDQFSK